MANAKLKMDIIKLLIQTRDETIEYYGLPAQNMNRLYAPGKWNIKEILVHLADAESILHYRIKRVIAEPEQLIQAFDQDLWCTALDYKLYPLELARDFFIANRASVIYLAEAYYEKLGAKQWMHSQLGPRTLKEEFDKVAAHNRAHLHQIKTALQTNNFQDKT
jgi:hypothetical protein